MSVFDSIISAGVLPVVNDIVGEAIRYRRVAYPRMSVIPIPATAPQTQADINATWATASAAVGADGYITQFNTAATHIDQYSQAAIATIDNDLFLMLSASEEAQADYVTRIASVFAVYGARITHFNLCVEANSDHTGESPAGNDSPITTDPDALYAGLAWIRSNYPDCKVGVSILYELAKTTDANLAAVLSACNVFDWVGLSTYPYATDPDTGLPYIATAAGVTTAHYRAIRDYTNLPVYIVESGWGSETSQADQATVFEAMHAACVELGFAGLCNTFLYDSSPWPGTFFDVMGLYDAAGATKDVYDSFITAVDQASVLDITARVRLTQNVPEEIDGGKAFIREATLSIPAADMTTFAEGDIVTIRGENYRVRGYDYQSGKGETIVTALRVSDHELTGQGARRRVR